MLQKLLLFDKSFSLSTENSIILSILDEYADLMLLAYLFNAMYFKSQWKEKFPKGCEIAILCIPSGAQEIVNELHELGVKGIVNFTREHFVLPEGMIRGTGVIAVKIDEITGKYYE